MRPVSPPAARQLGDQIAQAVGAGFVARVGMPSLAPDRAPLPGSEYKEETTKTSIHRPGTPGRIEPSHRRNWKMVMYRQAIRTLYGLLSQAVALVRRRSTKGNSKTDANTKNRPAPHGFLGTVRGLATRACPGVRIRSRLGGWRKLAAASQKALIVGDSLLTEIARATKPFRLCDAFCGIGNTKQFNFITRCDQSPTVIVSKTIR